MSKPTTVHEDFLDEDTEIPGQRYVLLSFLSPEKVLDKKELFFFKKFLESYEVEWKIKNLEKFLVDTVKRVNTDLDTHAQELEKKEQHDAAAICRKNRVRIDDVMADYGAFIQKSRSDITKTTLSESYDDFMYKHKDTLENEFHVAQNCQPTIRGLKVRGVYRTTKEAEIMAKKLQNKDKYHHIFMAEVGKWTPWDPSPNEVKDQEYNNEQLNGLMKKYKENENDREQHFEDRTKSAKQVSSTSTGQFDSMFGASGDLVMQRKLEKPTMTMERVEEASEAASEAASEPAVAAEAASADQ